MERRKDVRRSEEETQFLAVKWRFVGIGRLGQGRGGRGERAKAATATWLAR